MSELNFHNQKNTPISPPAAKLLILQRLTKLFKEWKEYEKNIPKQLRYSIAKKIDELMLLLIEQIITANFIPKNDKKELLQKSIISLDMIRFLLQLLWEFHGIDNDQYIDIEKRWSEVGKMLWGWKKQVEQ